MSQSMGDKCNLVGTKWQKESRILEEHQVPVAEETRYSV